MRKLIIAAAVVITAIGSLPLTAGNQGETVADQARQLPTEAVPGHH
ncbi:hypothetical protein [Mesobacterium pallidum]|nr:hypothetical protein [Mesobacterium pallidum]